jgi:biopolymer transport protein TolR
MAMSLAGAAATARRHRFGGRLRGYRPMAEINVTPFIDVMLVLLVIFMVTAPLLSVSVPVDLPKTSANAVSGNDEPLVVTINNKGELFLGETQYPPNELVAKLQAVSKEKPDQRLFVRGDRAIDYGKVMEVMGLLRDAGFTKVGLLAEQSAGRAPATGTPTTVTPPPRGQQPPPRQR